MRIGQTWDLCPHPALPVVRTGSFDLGALSSIGPRNASGKVDPPPSIGTRAREHNRKAEKASNLPLRAIGALEGPNPRERVSFSKLTETNRGSRGVRVAEGGCDES